MKSGKNNFLTCPICALPREATKVSIKVDPMTASPAKVHPVGEEVGREPCVVQVVAKGHLEIRPNRMPVVHIFVNALET